MKSSKETDEQTQDTTNTVDTKPMSKSEWIEAKAQEIDYYVRDWKTSVRKATARADKEFKK